MKKYARIFSMAVLCAMALVLALTPAVVYAVNANTNPQGMTVEVFSGNGLTAEFTEEGTRHDTLEEAITWAREFARQNGLSPLTGDAQGWALPPEQSDGMFMMALDEYGRIIGLPTFDEVYGIGLATLEDAIAEAFPSANLSIEDVAYICFDESLPHIQNLILRARYEIVFSEYVSWTVDGQMYKVNDDGSTEALPEFSRLFPGWDLGQIESISIRDFSTADVYSFSDSVQAMSHLFRASGIIHRQQAHVNAPVFVSVRNNLARMNWMQVTLTRMDWPIGAVNIGITNMNTGQSVGWVGNIRAGQGLLVGVPAFATAGVRASTVDNSGFVIIDGFQR
jgi:hypothetical protein